MKYCYLFLFFTFYIVHVNSQQIDCPQGFVERKVKCKGTMLLKCIPDNYACKNCWFLEFGNSEGNGWYPKDYFQSYDEALNVAQRIQRSGTRLYNANIYRIYVDGGEYCNTTTNSQSAVINDLKQKITPFLNRYRGEIQNYYRYINGQPYIPGNTITEYREQLKGAEKNLNDLTMMTNNINSENLKKIEDAFEDIQAQEIEIKNASANINKQITNEQIEKRNKEDEIKQEALRKETEERKKRESSALQDKTQDYIDNAKGASDGIMKAMYLGNAKINASVSGGATPEQLQAIKDLENEQKEETKAQMQKVTSDINSLMGSKSDNIVRNIGAINIPTQKISFDQPKDYSTSNIDKKEIKKMTTSVDDYDFASDSLKDKVVKGNYELSQNHALSSSISNNLPTQKPELTISSPNSLNSQELTDDQTKVVFDFIFGNGTSLKMGSLNSEDKKTASTLFSILLEKSCEINIVRELSTFDSPTLINISKLLIYSYKNINFCEPTKSGKYNSAVRNTIALDYKSSLAIRIQTGDWLY